MKISFTLLYVVGVLVVKNSVSGKSSIFNKYSSGPHFDVQKQDDAAFDDSKSRLEEKDNSIEALINSYKRSIDDAGLKGNVFETGIRKRSPYGLVYNQGKPIGILEPIPQSFEYSSYAPRDTSYRNNPYKSQWFPVKRESDFEMDQIEKDQLESQSSALHSNNYANVLAKFKVNNKVKHRPYQDYLNSQVKRAASPNLSRRKEMEDLKKRGALDMGDLKAKAKYTAAEELSSKVETDKVDEIEENLKDVMGDMGLVEKGAETQSQPVVQKREIYFEDEDLENGLNKIGLTKESHNNDRNKKEDCPGKTKVAKSKGSRKFTVDKGLHKKGKKKARKDDDKRSIKAGRKRVAEKKDLGAISEPRMRIANYQYEGEEYIRRKRQEKEAEKAEDSEIMKGLETSGDLTVSGNKSPLVAVTNAEDPELKKSEEKRDKEELEYEKRLERNIQTKINSIKEEVKREITKLKQDDAKKDQQRKKREITNTLLDGETSILDPDLNIDQKLEPHIRTRRDALHTIANATVKRETNAHSSIGSGSNKAKGQISINKMVREATKMKSSAKEQGNRASQKVKRSDPAADEIKKAAENEQTLTGITDAISKREEIINDAEREVEDSEKKVEKRNKDQKDSTSKIDELQEDLANKNIEKRDDAIVATDKVETDSKAEFATDIPGSIVKRDDQSTSGENDAKVDDALISETAADVVKRNEKHLMEATTDKCDENKAVEVKNVETNTATDTDSREDRCAENVISDLETGQTMLKDMDFDDNDVREERGSNDSRKADSKNSNSNNKHFEEEREERSAVVNKLNKAHIKQDKTAATHKTLRRNSDSEKMEGDLIKSSIAEVTANEDLAVGKASDLLNAQQSDATLNEEEKEESVNTNGDVQNDLSNVADQSPPAIEERSVDHQKMNSRESDDTISETNSFEQDARRTFGKPTLTNVQDLNNEEGGLNSEINDDVAILGTRKKRRIRNQRYRNRHKRDENSYSENKAEIMNYRGDDGEVDDEDDEMHDDGFDDQTSNFMSKRQADYDNSDELENGEEQEVNEEYPMYMERNKRNALRMYDDENDAEESHDNFLFYPNRFSRTKRHNYDNLMALHGGGMTRHSAALRERNMQPYEQNLRRKRLEKMNRAHDPKANVAELSESDIFGGFPQSYEGELSRFKRVKRSYLK